MPDVFRIYVPTTTTVAKTDRSNWSAFDTPYISTSPSIKKLMAIDSTMDVANSAHAIHLVKATHRFHVLLNNDSAGGRIIAGLNFNDSYPMYLELVRKPDVSSSGVNGLRLYSLKMNVKLKEKFMNRGLHADTGYTFHLVGNAEETDYEVRRELEEQGVKEVTYQDEHYGSWSI
jgi:hypothetical protein